MANNKKSFIIHLDSLEILDDLDDKNIAELFRAIRDYNKYGETKLEGIMKAVFNPFKNQFDRDLDKYSGIVERNKSNVHIICLFTRHSKPAIFCITSGGVFFGTCTPSPCHGTSPTYATISIS